MRLFPPLLLLLAARGLAAASPDLVASFDDPAGDANGPGSYQKPGDSDIVAGDFDLRHVEIRRDGNDVVFAVTLGAPFRQPAVTARTTVTPLPLWNNIYLQNIDIYIDTGAAGPGSSACIPGRRVAFAGGRTWKAAVVLTPQPGPARAVTEAALGEAGKRVLFPADVQTRGRTAIARVPMAALGGPPQPGWAISVQVSGARWERTFSVVDRVARGKPEADAFTMPVVGIAEAWAFGGGPEGSAHPRVVDVLLPKGADQRSVLGSFDTATGAWARVPFVELGPPSGPSAASPPPVAQPAPPALTVADIAGDTVTVSGVTSGIEPMRIGHVLDARGAPVAKIVVVRVLERGLVADIIEGADRVTRGAAVSFEAR